MRLLAAALIALFATACAHRATTPPVEASGFLEDYGLLRPGGPNELALVYRNPKAVWTSYDKVLLDPVTLWRSGPKALDPVPREDLLRLVTDFQSAVRARLREDFQFVDAPGPGVMRIRLAITEAQGSDPVLDVLTASRGTGRPHPAGGGPLDAETRRFIAAASIEGEIRDAQTNVLLAEGIDRRRSDVPPHETWADLDRAFASWAERVFGRLEARTHGH
ncbi:MAG TPA: DUF3313 domain-containing protein [Candidatus Eisenbacteria bacterium]|nr:DUF3313 domain-containing protein [Candidatus Eisenbacteria bacterium]